ncbi:MAG: OmpH family outer membrane protein [Prevotella sp.]|nr:OmpH family outer membrane protein [Prevotella sp.]
MKKFFMMLMLLAPMTMFAQKFGCVDYDAVAQDLPEYAKAQGDLQALAKQYDNDLQSMQEEFKRKAEEYDKTKSTMNATKQEETEQALMEMQQKIQQAYQDNSQQLQQKQQELLNPIQAKVAKAIETVGTNGKYVYIVMKNSLPFINPTLCDDVTEACKSEVRKLK